MGFTVSFRSIEPVSEKTAKEIDQFARELVHGRSWLSCEPPLLRQRADGHLSCACKPAFELAPDEVEAADEEGLPDGTIRDVLDILTSISRDYRVDWEVVHDYSDGCAGEIRGGVCDEALLALAGGLITMRDGYSGLLDDDELEIDDSSPTAPDGDDDDDEFPPTIRMWKD